MVSAQGSYPDGGTHLFVNPLRTHSVVPRLCQRGLSVEHEVSKMSAVRMHWGRVHSSDRLGSGSTIFCVPIVDSLTLCRNGILNL